MLLRTACVYHRVPFKMMLPYVTNYSELIRMSPETKAILRAAMNRFELDRDGIHGVAHWGRVRANGFRLAQLTGANVYVVELFALIHDSCRIDDGHDPEHGLRAAGFAEDLVQRGILPDRQDGLGTADYRLPVA